MAEDLLPPYKEIEPYETGFLDTEDGHSIFWEKSGNPDGIPAVFLHGGPGSGSSPYWRRIFDPEKYNIIQFDQRGSGKSTPHASLENNTTQHLISDMEKLREFFNIEKWVVVGGSWGSTLAIAYADLHADRTLSLVMYGIFLSRQEELKTLYFEDGVAHRIFPDVFEQYIDILPDADRQNPIEGYRKLFESADADVRAKAIDYWTRLEKKVSKLIVTDDELKQQMSDPDFVISHSLIENHYFLHNGFINGDDLLSGIGQTLKSVPVHIIQGRYDIVCPFKTAWELHNAIPNSVMHIIDDVGHTARDPKVTSKLVHVLDELSF